VEHFYVTFGDPIAASVFQISCGITNRQKKLWKPYPRETVGAGNDTEHGAVSVRYLSFFLDLCRPLAILAAAAESAIAATISDDDATQLFLRPFGDVRDVTDNFVFGHVPGYFRSCLHAGAGLPGSEKFRPIIAVVLRATLTGLHARNRSSTTTRLLSK